MKPSESRGRSPKPGPKPGMKTSPSGGAVIWEDAPTKFLRRVTYLQIYGDTATGRTSLALTAPGPIALLHAEEKIDGIVQKFPEKGIRLHCFGGRFSGSHQEIATQASAQIEQFKAALDDAFSWAKTVIVDTHTEAWELLRLARFGTLNPSGHVPSLYGPVNAEWKGLFRGHRAQDRYNLICIGQIKEQYRNNKPTGKLEQAGQKEMKYPADVIVRMDRPEDDRVVATIEKAWWNEHMVGLELENEEVTFLNLMSLITETDAEEWE